MAHYAQIDKNNIVVNVSVVSDEFTEAVEWLTENYGPEWIVTSYNTRGGIHYSSETGEPDDGTPIYYNYASIGYVWDSEDEAFYNPVPTYESWILDKSTYTWVPPVPKPNDWPDATWNEPTICWAKEPTPFPSWNYNIDTDKWDAPFLPPDGIQCIWNEAKQNWIVIPPPYPSWAYDPYKNAWVPPINAPDAPDRLEVVFYNYSWDDEKQEWYSLSPLSNT